MREKDREKFKRLAEKRVNTAIKTMRLIGNLCNKSNYFYTDKDIEKIFSVLNKELKASRSRFDSENVGNKGTFKLD